MKETEYTVVIPHRAEGDELKETIDNIAGTQENCAAIIAEEDRAGRGTGPTRHAGTVKAKTDIVITTDAHMRFQPGALDNLAAFIGEDPTRIGCLSCRTNPECAFAGASYWGADLYEWGGEYALEPKWSKNRLGPGEVACVMGACYGFSKAFYEALGSPWSLARGWGCDETLLSIPAWLAGGSVHVLADECAHRLKTGADVGYRQSDAEISAIWYTRYLLLEYVRPDNLPELRARMRRSASSPARFPKAVREAAEQLDKVRKLSWAEFAAEWLIRDVPAAVPPAAPACEPETPPAVPVHPVHPVHPAFGPLPSVPDPGVRCPHCGRISDRHRITNTWPNGNRRRLCDRCGRPFVSRFPA